MLEALLDLLRRHVDHRTAVAVELLDLLELPHDLLLAHGVDRAVADLLTVNVDRPECLASTIFRLNGRPVRPRGQCLIPDDLQVAHVPLVGRAVLLGELRPQLLDLRHDMRIDIRVRQALGVVLGPLLWVARTQDGLLGRHMPVASDELVNELPLLRSQRLIAPAGFRAGLGADRWYRLVDFIQRRLGDPAANPSHECVSLLAHATLQTRHPPSTFRHENRQPWRLEYIHAADRTFFTIDGSRIKKLSPTVMSLNGYFTRC